MELEIDKIASLFGVNISSFQKIRSAYKCISDTGIVSIKETDLSPEKLIFEHSVKEHLCKNGFTQIDRFYENIETNMPYAERNNRRYIMTRYISGRECDLDQKSDLAMAVKTLAKLHLASLNYAPNSDMIVKNDLGRLIGSYEKRTNELIRLRKKLKKELVLDDFDKLFLENADYFVNLATEATNILKSSNYIQLSEKTEAEKSFCHHDYAFHNIIIDENGILNVLDFQHASYELKIYDLANVIKRHMRKCEWDINKCIYIIKTYHAIVPINNDELLVLYSMLMFPQKLWRIANRYYNSKKLTSNSNYYSKLVQESEQIECHKKFIKEYKKTLLN